MLDLLHAWVLFPAVVALVGYGWGLLVERASNLDIPGALIVPLGIAAVVVVVAMFTSFDATASLATPAIAVGALGGLAWRWRAHRIEPAPAIAAVAVLLAYGAPVLLSGKATFAGYVKLDDTATWLAFTDQLMAHGRSLSSLPPSTYQQVLQANLDTGYPVGTFLPFGVGRALVGMDGAWVFQPYMAFCGALIALCAHTLLAPFVASRRLRAFAAFIAAQPALLYGYSLWGGLKEMTLAFLVMLAVAVAGLMLARSRGRPRDLLPLAVVAAALTDVIGPGAAVWVVPLLGAVALVWLWRLRGQHAVGGGVVRMAFLGALTLALALPAWLILGKTLPSEAVFTKLSTHADLYGNLFHSLSPFQLAGIWPVTDFRVTAPTFPTAALVAVVAAAALGALWWSWRHRSGGVAAYVALVVLAYVAGQLVGTAPWVLAKTIAIASPAVLLAAMAGAALLWSRSRVAGGVVMALIAGGVLWSNVLAYHDVVLAPRDRLSELEHIGTLVDGKGPTFDNQYEPYSARHFLRAGAPIEPAEYRFAPLPLIDGRFLTKTAYADIDAFPLTTLLPYRSIVVGAWPGESRPPSVYEQVWRGRYYALYQRPEHPATRIVTHVPLGDSVTLPYCGNAQVGTSLSLCPVNPVATAACTRIRRLARIAQGENAQLVAYERSGPIVVRGDQTLWPGRWTHDPLSQSLEATSPGSATAHIRVDGDERYELWLGGYFARGFDVTVDGRRVGRVENELANIGLYVHVADFGLTAGVHTFVFTYPHGDLTPGSADSAHHTGLSAIALQPTHGLAPRLLTVAPRDAASLCGRPLDWIELVAPS